MSLSVAGFITPGIINHNVMNDVEVVCPPDDAVSCMAFSPSPIPPTNFLIAGSWDSLVRCWKIEETGNSVPQLQQSMTAPVLDVAWSDDGSKVFMAGCDKMAKCWDLASNQCTQVAAHEAPIKTCHWIKSSHYNCLMTGSWDKTVKFWDLRVQQPVVTLQLPERVYCADAESQIAVVSTAGRQIVAYILEKNPPEMTTIPSKLKNDHRCMSICKDTNGIPSGFAVGSVGGQVTVQNFNSLYPDGKSYFTFKCHRSELTSMNHQDVYAVNDVKFHPHHGTLATAGSDGTFGFWDKTAKTKLSISQKMVQHITACCFSPDGQICAYSVGYDWSKGHEFNNPQNKNHIFLHPCFEKMKPKAN